MYLIGKRGILCKLWFQIVTLSASKQILKRIQTSKWFWKQSFNRLSNEHFVTRDELEFVFSRKDEHTSEIDGKELKTLELVSSKARKVYVQHWWIIVDHSEMFSKSFF